MIKIYLLLILFSVNAWSKVSLELVFSNPSVKQGEIAVGKLVVKEIDGQSVLAGLKGKNLSKTLYLLQVAPFMGKAGKLESEVKFIFLAVPQTTAITENISGEEVFVSWNNIEVIPTEQSKSFLLGDFEIPVRKKILKWVLIGICFILILGLFSYYRKVFLRKGENKKKLDLIRKELMNCVTYNDIVSMWGQKHRYLEVYPALDQNFKNLEKVLFKYQFKQQRTESEIKEITSAYSQFKTTVSEVINAK